MWIINLIPAWDRDNFVLRIWNHYERCDLIEKLAISTFARASCSFLLKAERFLSTRLNNLIVSFGENFFIVENFNAQINSVFECVTCNRGPYLQITVYSSIFGSLTKINWSKQTLKLSALRNILRESRKESVAFRQSRRSSSCQKILAGKLSNLIYFFEIQRLLVCYYTDVAYTALEKRQSPSPTLP